ncbi:MAG: hypothetical protein EOP82_21630 [Variovorax sp.]|nr:MAG: hypothetical protein EOP82_21630 [Variovorax sp.]
MNWQLILEVPATTPSEPLDSRDAWQHAFVAEWHRLSEECADLEQTAELASELYPSRGTGNPVEVAREEWGTPA